MKQKKWEHCIIAGENVHLQSLQKYIYQQYIDIDTDIDICAVEVKLE